MKRVIIGIYLLLFPSLYSMEHSLLPDKKQKDTKGLAVTINIQELKNSVSPWYDDCLEGPNRYLEGCSKINTVCGISAAGGGLGFAFGVAVTMLGTGIKLFPLVAGLSSAGGCLTGIIVAMVRLYQVEAEKKEMVPIIRK